MNIMCFEPRQVWVYRYGLLKGASNGEELSYEISRGIAEISKIIGQLSFSEMFAGGCVDHFIPGRNLNSLKFLPSALKLRVDCKASENVYHRLFFTINFTLQYPNSFDQLSSGLENFQVWILRDFMSRLWLQWSESSDHRFVAALAKARFWIYKNTDHLFSFDENGTAVETANPLDEPEELFADAAYVTGSLNEKRGHY